MPDATSALYVRLPLPEAERLDRAAEQLGVNKKTLITHLVRHHLEEGNADVLTTKPGGGPGPVIVQLQDEPMTVGHASFTPAPPAALPDVLTPEQAGALLQVDADEIVAMADKGDLPGRRIGDHWRFSKPALLAWLAGG